MYPQISRDQEGLGEEEKRGIDAKWKKGKHRPRRKVTKRPKSVWRGVSVGKGNRPSISEENSKKTNRYGRKGEKLAKEKK